MFQFIAGLFAGLGAAFVLYRILSRENRRLEEDRQVLAQEKTIVLDFMHHMAEAIGEGVNREQLFQRVTHAAVLSTNALSACLFERRQDGSLAGVAVEGLFPPLRELPESVNLRHMSRAQFIGQIMRSEVFADGEGLVGEAASKGEGILIANAQRDPRIVNHGDAALAIISLIVVPMRFRDRTLGVLAIANPADGMPFGETDFSLSLSLAEQAALAIHNLDLMAFQIERSKLKQDLALATNIQSMLLPQHVPAYEKLDVDARYFPAQSVGGDLYDLIALSETRLAVTIADVSGKGIPASIVMAICQSNLRHLARYHQDSPKDVLRELNRVMTEELSSEMFVTIVFAVIDLERKTLAYVRAGHELPLLFHQDTGTGLFQTYQLGSEGMALGMVPAEIFDDALEVREVPFAPGDIFVLYTDGITEATNAEGTEFSTARLADTIRSLRTKSASEVDDGILNKLKQWSGDEEQHDDVTLVTIKHLG